MSGQPPPLPEPRHRGPKRTAAAARSWAALACAFVLLVLAVWAVVQGLTVGWFVDVRLIWVVAAVLGTWLAGRTAVAARRAGSSRAIVRAGWGLAVVGALVLAVDLVPTLLELVPRPDRWLSSGATVQRSVQVPGMRASLSHQPGDGERDVAPDAEVVVTVHGASFGPARPQLKLSLSNGYGQDLVYDCDRVERRGRRLRCTPRTPLQHGCTYQAAFTASVSPGKGSAPVELSWSFSTSAASTPVRGVTSEGISLVVRDDRDIEVEGVAGTAPRRALARGWKALVRGDDAHEWPISIRDDGGLDGVLSTADGRRLKDTRDLYLELRDKTGSTVVRLPLGPVTENEGRTVRLVRGRPLRWTTPEGVVLVFEGKMSKGETAWVTVERSDMTRCAKRLHAQLGWGGAWQVDTRFHRSSPAPYRRRSSGARVEGPPLVDLLFPAPPEVGDDAFVFDATCVNTGWNAGHPKTFLLRDVGRVEKVDGTRYLSFGKAFPVEGHGASGPEEVDPGTVYDQPLDGHHIMLYERDRAFALVVGDYSGRRRAGDFYVKDHAMVHEPFALPYLAAPLPKSAVDRATRSNRTLAILPVLAQREFELESRNMATGWRGSMLEFRPLRRQAMAAIFVGDLDELTHDPR